ncbi:unnamed protein product [Brassica rapa]|uniref:Uncharacterized protein n=1 Tax=Brassica campestris TaxID=3711 RepID=A0A3P5Y533_BRACM|nr:unnamed protein product [Brassica rapa]VDC62632.1 unnamed protein product [Brassica rapa]
MKEDLPKIYNVLTAEKSQDLIINKGGAQLLAKMVTKTDDPQTLRMYFQVSDIFKRMHVKYIVLTLTCLSVFCTNREVSQTPETRGRPTEIVRISGESSRDDNCSLARKILRSKHVINSDKN